MECTVAFHVGCARWSSNAISRIIFQPESDEGDVVVGGYCLLHASNIGKERLSMRTSHESSEGSNRASEEESDEIMIQSKKHAENITSNSSLKRKRSMTGNGKNVPWSNTQHRFLVDMKARMWRRN